MDGAGWLLAGWVDGGTQWFDEDDTDNNDVKDEKAKTFDITILMNGFL